MNGKRMTMTPISSRHKQRVKKKAPLKKVEKTQDTFQRNMSVKFW